MAYDYSKLSGLITEKYGSQLAFSKALGISERSLSLKLNNKVGFKQIEIENSCKLLGIKKNEIAKYFFKLQVQNFKLEA